MCLGGRPACASSARSACPAPPTTGLHPRWAKDAPMNLAAMGASPIAARGASSARATLRSGTRSRRAFPLAGRPDRRSACAGSFLYRPRPSHHPAQGNAAVRLCGRSQVASAASTRGPHGSRRRSAPLRLLRSMRRPRTTPSTAGSGPVSTIAASSPFCDNDSRGSNPLHQASRRPPGPAALNWCTQSRKVWRSIPPNLCRSFAAHPIQDRRQR